MGIATGTVVAKRYRVLELLGKGGMGEVFKAENTRTGRLVAVKVLRAESKHKASAIERFRREARAAGSIQSDFVTQVIDVEDDPDHGIVLVFEFLEGESLVERLKRTGPVSFNELWGIVEAVWMGLADAHAAGVIHRDLKPSNVFLEMRKNGGRRVKILDFGISKLPKKISTHSLTQVGQSLGTFSFMPPEQIGKAKSVDHRADIYSATTLVFQALSGKLPYHAKNVVAMMELKTKTEPRTLTEAMGEPIDPELEAFVARGLARNPDDRFQTSIEALDSWRALKPPDAISFLDLDVSGSHPRLDAILTGDAATVPMPQLQEMMRAAAPPSPRPRQESRPPVVTEPVMDAAQGAPVLSSASADVAERRANVPVGVTLPIPYQHPVDDTEPTRRQAVPAGLPHMPLPTPAPAPVEPPAEMEVQQSSALRMWIALILGAIGLMLVGFLAVALVLKFLLHP